MTWVARIAGRKVFHLGSGDGKRLVKSALWDEDARAGDACLPAIDEPDTRENIEIVRLVDCGLRLALGIFPS
jgi:hypothetical protein